MNKNIVYRFQVFFFKVHYIALFYAFLIVPLAILGGFVGAFISHPFILLALFAPIGPISITLHPVLSCMYPIYWFPSPGLPLNYSELLIIVVVMVFKLFIYMLLRGTKVVGKSTLLILSMATLITCTISTLAWRDIAALVASLITTLSMDLTVLSYVKYRDAVNGIASRVWIPILATLWSSSIWVPVIAYTKEWLDWIKQLFHPIPIAIIIAVWATITIVQLALVTEYYIKHNENHQSFKSYNNTYAGENNTAKYRISPETRREKEP